MLRFSAVQENYLIEINVSEMPQVVGWERNSKGKLSSKFVDLSPSMDPAK